MMEKNGNGLERLVFETLSVAAGQPPIMGTQRRKERKWLGVKNLIET
jgi:hypothetical protein